MLISTQTMHGLCLPVLLTTSYKQPSENLDLITMYKVRLQQVNSVSLLYLKKCIMNL